MEPVPDGTNINLMHALARYVTESGPVLGLLKCFDQAILLEFLEHILTKPVRGCRLHSQSLQDNFGVVD